MSEKTADTMFTMVEDALRAFDALLRAFFSVGMPSGAVEQIAVRLAVKMAGRRATADDPDAQELLSMASRAIDVMQGVEMKKKTLYEIATDVLGTSPPLTVGVTNWKDSLAASWGDARVRLTLEHPSGASISIGAVRDGKLSLMPALSGLYRVAMSEWGAPLAHVSREYIAEGLRQRVPAASEVLHNLSGAEEMEETLRTVIHTADLVDARLNSLMEKLTSLCAERAVVEGASRALDPEDPNNVNDGFVYEDVVRYLDAVKALLAKLDIPLALVSAHPASLTPHVVLRAMEWSYEQAARRLRIECWKLGNNRNEYRDLYARYEFLDHQARVLRDESTAYEAGMFDALDEQRLYPSVVQDYRMRLMGETPLFNAPPHDLSMSRG